MNPSAAPALRFGAPAVPRLSARAWALVAIAAATGLGFALRLAAVRGDLGLDEVWSLALVARIHALGQVFWGISHDNNHFLNSAWLYSLGPDRPTWLYRLPAVLMGTLTIPAAARLGWHSSPAAGVAAAVLSAVALPLVDFGSEARGYAGLGLATVLAIHAWRQAVALRLGKGATGPRGVDRAAWHLGLAAGFGMLCHLTMLWVVAVLGLATLIRLGARLRRALPTLAATVRLFSPAGLLMLPACAAVGAGMWLCHGFRIGDADPFTWEKLATGYGGMLLLMSGLPEALPPWLGMAGAMALIAALAGCGLVDRNGLALAAAALIALPLAIGAAHLPNVGYCRYFSGCGIVLLVVQAEAFGTLWRRGGAARRRVLAGLLAVASGGLALDVVQIHVGRAASSETLGLMMREGAPDYFASRPVMAEMLLGDAGRRRHASAAYARPTEFCRQPPEWYIDVGTYDPGPDSRLRLGPEACPTSYRRRKTFLAAPLSGTQWTLYRKN